MWRHLFAALALVLVIEGMFPFINPAAWRKSLQKLCAADNKNLRIYGFICMLVGVVSLTIIHRYLY